MPTDHAAATPDPVGQRISRLAELVEQQFAPNAVEVDRRGRFPAANIDGLAELGLLGMAVGADRGGLGFDGPSMRTALRVIGSGCGSTAFAFAQHHGTIGSVAATTNDALRAEWLPSLLNNSLAGTAFAHVRRPGSPVLAAVADGDRWVLSGTAPWVTSWGHAVVMSVAATTDDGRLVWSLLPMVEGNGISVVKRFDLAAFQATSTVALRFDGVIVDPDQLLRLDDRAAWARKDRAMAARPSPLCLGIGDRALAELAEIEPKLAEACREWFDELSAAAEVVSATVDDANRSPLADPAHEALIDVAATSRTDVIVGVQRLTTALLAATGGSAMDRSRRAQLLSREALFYVVQAQSPDGRRATLDRLVRWRPS